MVKLYMKRDLLIPRLLQRPDRSFFLFGPRGTGKSTWLEKVLPEALGLDLLDASLFLELSRDPHGLEAMVGSRRAGAWVVLDEIQKIPALLDEVHRLMELRRWPVSRRMLRAEIHCVVADLGHLTLTANGRRRTDWQRSPGDHLRPSLPCGYFF